MKKLLIWTGAAALLMIGCPWLALTFAGSAGMAVCFLLFYGANPLFCAFCGAFAGRQPRQLWPLPLMVAGLFLAGAWIFFELGEPAFFLYAACYLAIGFVCMLVSALLTGRKR